MFRILSIDGGGIKGMFPASFIACLEEKLGSSIANYFDLIAGTSTGGIIAIGLGLGLTGKELVTFYKKYGPSIFSSSWKPSARFRHYFSPKYKADPLRSALMDVFGERLLGESVKRLIIPSFNAQTGKIYIYKTPHSIRYESDWRISAVDVAMATSAAPSYFPPYVSRDFISHLDGGLWANNPTGNAVVEAIGVLKQDPLQIRVLSLGTTCIAQSFTLAKAGLIGWRKKALEAAFAGQSFGSMGIAAVLVGHQNILRVNPYVEKDKFELDNASLMDELEATGSACARDEIPRFRELFTGETAQIFEPFHGPRKPKPSANGTGRP